MPGRPARPTSTRRSSSTPRAASGSPGTRTPRGAGRVAWAVSEDGAATFTPAQALSGAPFAFTTSRDMPGWLGDGLQLLVSGNRLLAAWSDPSDPAGNAPTWLDPVHVHVRTASLPP